MRFVTSPYLFHNDERKSDFLPTPNLEKDLVEVRIDTNKGHLWFGLPKRQALNLGYTNLKEVATKHGAWKSGFVFCASTDYSNTSIKTVYIEKLK